MYYHRFTTPIAHSIIRLYDMKSFTSYLKYTTSTTQHVHPTKHKIKLLFKYSNGYCISPNVRRYFGLVTGPPPPPAMEAAATERFRRERSSVANLTRINLIFNLRHRRSEVTVFTPFCLFVTWRKFFFAKYIDRLFVSLCVCMSVILHTRGHNSCPIFMKFEPQIGIRISRSPIDFQGQRFKIKVKIVEKLKFSKTAIIRQVSC